MLLYAGAVFPVQSGHAGVLATDEVISNGKKNLADPLFSETVNFDAVFGDEVQYVLTDNKSLEQTVKVDILRSALTAQEHLPEAAFSLEDISASAYRGWP